MYLARDSPSLRNGLKVLKGGFFRLRF